MNYNTLAVGIGVGLGAAFSMAILLITEQFYILGIFGLITTIVGATCLIIQSHKLDKSHFED